MNSAPRPFILQSWFAWALTNFNREFWRTWGDWRAKVNMIVGNGQPGRMKLAEDRLVVLEKNDLRRNVYDRIVIAAITFAITFGMSALLAWRSLLGFK